MSTKVSDLSASQSAMIDRAKLPRTLMGDTPAMRAAGKTYLPQEPAEKQDAYENRLARSTLFNAYGKTVDDMTGKVFTKPIVIGSDVPEKLRGYAEDIDRTGRHLNNFARDAFHDALQTGIGYILTDMPRALPRDDARPITVAEEQAAGLRPYLVYIKLENLLGYKSETVAGVEQLTQVRVKECVSEPDGEFAEKAIEQVRVLEPGKWRTFRKAKAADGSEEWQQFEEGTTSLSKITLAPVYFHRTSFMTGSPPLAKLAEINVAHWQSQSDQRNILHVARVPILFGSGFAPDTEFSVGAGTMIRNSDSNAKLTYVEHSGKAIEAGDKEIANLEFQMQTMGLQLLVPQPGGKTATGEIRDDAKENSPLAMMAQALQDALEASFGFMAEYMGLGPDKGGSLVVNADFGIQGSRADLQALLDAVNAEQISKKTFWAEWQRRGVLSDAFDPEVEKDRIASEAPRLGGAMNLDHPHSH